MACLANNIKRKLREEEEFIKKHANEIFPNFSVGPLSKYRNQATFDWKKLKIIIDGEDRTVFKHKIWTFIRNHDEFESSSQVQSLDEKRRQTHLQFKVFQEMNAWFKQEIENNPRLAAALVDSAMIYNLEMMGKIEINYILVPNVIKRLGTAGHQRYIDAIEANEITGCFALTEVAHGSNAIAIQTTATHDIENNQFVLHTRSFEAAKCWAGNLGFCATHAVVYARLITSDGRDHGPNVFIVPIRCPKTRKSLVGVIVGDLGEKIGLNGIDNGFLIFDSYRIPADNLLNRFGDVDTNGKYTSTIENPKKRYATFLSVLSSGRIQIALIATNLLLKSLTVALRYSAVRKQFGPENSDEFPIIEYQQQQFRLFPYLAVTYATKIFSFWLSEKNAVFVKSTYKGMLEFDSNKALELHALSSVSKPAVTWMARDGIQICREACGGHGYLKASGIGNWRNENDANCTYEGENSVLMQQTSNWLLSLWNKVINGEKVIAAYGTAEFLNYYKKIPTVMKVNSIDDALRPEMCLIAYKWMIIYYLKMTTNKIECLLKHGKDRFEVKNDTQSYHAATISVIFAEHAIVEIFHKFVIEIDNENCRKVLMKLFLLYGLWNLEKHLGTLYMGKFFQDDAGQYIREAILELCLSLKPEVVSLVDVLAPPDFAIDSILGSSDGNVYQCLQTHVFSNPNAFSRPTWWREIQPKKTHSKL